MKRPKRDLSESELVLNFSENLQNLTKTKVKMKLYEKLSISRSTWYRYENALSFPDVFTLKRIADLLNVTIDYLLSYNQNI